MHRQPSPEPDPGVVGRLRDALAGGHLAYLRDLDAAEHLERQLPGLGGLVRSAWAFHRRAAAWAVTNTPAVGTVFTAAGFPVPDGPLHAAAAEIQPAARFAYADLDPSATAMNRGLLASKDPERVAAFCAPWYDPAAVLSAPEAPWTASGAPLSVHVILALHRAPGDAAMQMLHQYAELLPQDSSVCLTLVIPAPGEAGEALIEAAEEVTRSCVYRHSLNDVEQWIASAGLLLHPDGVAYVPQWAARPARRPPAARVAEAVATVP
jgi:hypothetical protein